MIRNVNSVSGLSNEVFVILRRIPESYADIFLVYSALLLCSCISNNSGLFVGCDESVDVEGAEEERVCG